MSDDQTLIKATLVTLMAILAMVIFVAALHWLVYRQVMNNLHRIEKIEQQIHHQRRQ